MEDQRSVLITGAGGHVGSFVSSVLGEHYELVLCDRVALSNEQHRCIQLDLGDLEALTAACQGVDTVVHLAADPSVAAEWESILPNNIIGTYNAFEAARQAGCRRVIYASSINTVRGYPSDVQVHISMPVRPPNLYGASKVWGEALARLYTDQHGLSALCLRFGWVAPRDHPNLRPSNSMLDCVITLDDAARLIHAAIEALDSLRFGIFHGLSNNRFKHLDISESREILGYEPQDDAFALAELLEEQDKQSSDSIVSDNEG